MPGKKKKFIDKKNSVTFVLGHRSQRDPLIVDETAPQNVLIPIDQAPTASPSSGPSAKSSGDKVDRFKRKEEQLKYGIYFDDDYDYLQHMKDSSDMGGIEWDICERIYAPNRKADERPPEIEFKDAKLQLPSSVFESAHQEAVGLLNKAAPVRGPRPDLDPDVVAAMEEDFDFEDPDNILEDNFIDLATGGEGLEGDYEGDSGEDDDEYEDCSDDGSEARDSVGSLEGPQYTFADEETKSKFTNYSMSSSTIYRNKQLELLDDQFEKMFEGYDDTEIGALDCDEIEGHLNPDSEMVLNAATEFEEDRRKEEFVNAKISRMVLDEDSSASEDTDSDSDDCKKEKWDCESILSTYSTTRNRPKLIKELPKNKIRVSGRTGMPVGELGKGITTAKLRDLDAEYARESGINSARPVRSIISGVTSMRDRNETPEQRHERKKQVKEYRRERRLERKANTEAFRDEKKRQERVRLNTKANLQGLKL